jgi:hypothetical protein
LEDNLLCEPLGEPPPWELAAPCSEALCSDDLRSEALASADLPSRERPSKDRPSDFASEDLASAGFAFDAIGFFVALELLVLLGRSDLFVPTSYLFFSSTV